MVKRLWWTFVVGYAFMSLWVPGVVARTRAAGLSVSSAVAAGPTSLAVRQVALLTAPAAAGPVMFGAPSFNGGTLAAPGFHLDAVGDVVNGPVTVFGEPSGGWSSSVAPGVFEPPAGEIATAAAAANGAVAVTERSTSAETGDIVVLTRPAGGWSGSLTPTAHLVVASGQPQFGLAAANGAFVTSTPGGPIRVFAQPAGGWSGNVQQRAQLSASDGSPLYGMAASGRTVVAASLKAIYVFEEPAGGWSGALHETARIAIPSDGIEPVISGDTIAIVGAYLTPQLESPLYVLHRPEGGWQDAKPSSPRAYFSYGPDEAGPSLTVADGIVSFTTGHTEPNHMCPCTASVWTIGQLSSEAVAPIDMPVRRSSTLSSIISASGSLSGRTLAVGGVDGVHIDTVSAPAEPRISQVALGGLTGRPMLSLHLAARAGQPRIASLRLTLPAGLHLATNRAAGRSGVTATGSRRTTVQRRDGYLVLTFGTARAATTVRIGAGVLLESASLRRSLARIAQHGGRRTLSLPCQITDTTGRASQLEVTLTAAR